MMTDANQNIVWQASYTPFGLATVTNETVVNNIRFPGQYYDAESGLHYNYFRDYDPEIGRYIQSDPIGLRGGMNTYAYVGGNPTNYIDPYGLNRWRTVFYRFGKEPGRVMRDIGRWLIPPIPHTPSPQTNPTPGYDPIAHANKGSANKGSGTFYNEQCLPYDN